MTRTEKNRKNRDDALIETKSIATISEKDAKKVTLGALLGTAMEWYDFFLFSAASALVFNQQYFVSKDPITATLASFATFGVGLVMRPIGGMLFGALGDKLGRRRILMITVLGIGIVTGIIGLLPNFMIIGVWAPIMLVILRMAQGLFVGGEWGGAMTIVVENVPLEKRARYAAIPQVGSPIGTILSSGGFFLVTIAFSAEGFNSVGWRIPFLAAIPMLLLTLYIRRKLEESPVFKMLQQEDEIEKSPIVATLRESWRQIIVGMAAAFLGVGGFYLVTAFFVWYGVNQLHYDSSLMLLGGMVGAAIEIPVLIYGGRLAERYGASKLIIWGGVATIVAAFPAFWMLESGNPILVLAAMMLATATLSTPYAASGTVLTGLFPARTRYTGVSLSQNIAGMLAGAVPILATAFVAGAGMHWWPAALMLMVIALFTAVSGLISPKLSVKLENFKH